MDENNFGNQAQMGFHQQQWNNPNPNFYQGQQPGGISHNVFHHAGGGGMVHGAMHQMQPAGPGLQYGGGMQYGGMMQPPHGGAMFQHAGGMPQQQGWPNHPGIGGNQNPNFMNNQNCGWNNQNYQQQQNQANNFGNQNNVPGISNQEQYDFQINKNSMVGDMSPSNINLKQNQNSQSKDELENFERRIRDRDSHRRRDRRKTGRSDGKERNSRSPPRRDDRGRSPLRHDDRGRSPLRHDDRGRSPLRHDDRDRSRTRRDDKDMERDRSPRRDKRRDSPDRYERRRREDRRREDYDSDRQRDSRNMNVKPTNTIMLKSLHPSVDERDIQEAVQKLERPVLDVRLVRNKETGASRGFAFVEFYQVAEAKSWMEENQGRVMVGGYLAHMAYGASKEREDDWYCSQCGTQNFKRRDHCFHCSISKIESEQYSEVSPLPTKVIILNGLGQSTMEDKVCTAINYISAVKLINVLISRDTQGSSRGYCYVELVSLEHSQHLYNTLQAMDPPFTVEEHPVSVCYGKEDYLTRTQGSNASSSSQSNFNSEKSNTNQQEPTSPQRKSRRGPRKSSMSAAEKAAVAQEQIQAARQLQLQQQHVSQQLVTEMQGSNQSESSDHDTKETSDNPKDDVPNEDGSEEPDLSTYTYDETSGFYYDSRSGLYYDANSQYFYNATTQQYMYWDSEKQTYIPAPTSNETNTQQDKTETKMEQKVTEVKEKEKKRSDKSSQARKIAKDMERWAKSMNNAKMAPSASKKAISFSIDNSAGAADAGFAMLQKKGNPLETQAAVAEAMSKNAASNMLVAYGGGSDSEEEEETQAPRESIDLDKLIDSLTDWNKLICLLCKRQFQTKEVLIKHQNMSDLHKQNLEAKKKSLMASNESEAFAPELKYRDRAKERRDKFGSMPPPEPSRRSKNRGPSRPPIAYEEPTAGGIKSDNIGNRMLQKMGWNEGTGLGKQKQGIKDPIEVSRRATGAGLGAEGSRYQRDVSGSDDYRTTVHKLTRQRYKEIQ